MKRKIITDKYFFYFKFDFKFMHMAFDELKKKSLSSQNINATVIKHNIVKVPIGNSKNKIEGLKEFCEKYDIELIEAYEIDLDGKGFEKLMTYFKK